VVNSLKKFLLSSATTMRGFIGFRALMLSEFGALVSGTTALQGKTRALVRLG